jgi:hypothetical protein
VRYVRAVALAAVAVILCLLLTGCPDDVNPGMPPGGPPAPTKPLNGQSPVPILPTPSCDLITHPDGCGSNYSPPATPLG